MTTQEDITRWWQLGKEKQATHMIVATDTFSYEDYPVYVSDKENVYEVMKGYQQPDKCSSVMEVYSYKLTLEAQLREHRSFNFQ